MLAMQSAIDIPNSETTEQYHFKWHSSSNEISERLWKECFPASIEGRWWYQALENSKLESQFHFLYLTVENSQGPVAIAPVFLMDVPLQIMAPAELKNTLDFIARFAPFLTKIKTLFVGSPCADEGAIGVIPGANKSAVIDTISKACEQMAKKNSAGMIVWKDFPEHESAIIATRADKWKLYQIPSYPGAELELPKGDFDAYLGSLKKSRRQNMKKKLARGKEVLPLSAEIIKTPDDSLLNQIFGLFWKTYEKGNTKFEQLSIEFFKQIRSTDTARFLLLRDTQGKLVAFRLFFELDGKIINKFIGLDYSVDSEAYLLFRLVEEGIRYAIERGITTIQSGQTGYRAKLETGHKLVPLYNFIRHRNPILNRGLVVLAREISWNTVDEEVAEYLKAHPQALPAVHK